MKIDHVGVVSDKYHSNYEKQLIRCWRPTNVLDMQDRADNPSEIRGLFEHGIVNSKDVWAVLADLLSRLLSFVLTEQ